MKLGLSLGFGRPSSGGGYYITIPGASGGLFDETTGEIGAIATASTNLPDIGNGLTWSMVAGSDADISIHATTGVVSSARAIYDGDSATFSLRVENGEVGVDEGAIAIEAPFEAVGTVAGSVVSTFLSGNDLVDNANATKTWAGLSLGAASANRTIIVGVTRRIGTGTLVINTMTVGGVSATRISTFNIASGYQIEFWGAAVPTGTTGDVVINVAEAGVGRISVILWHTTGVQSLTATDSKTDNTISSRTLSVSLNVSAGGAGFAATYFNQGDLATTTWAGLTERYSTSSSDSGAKVDGASLDFATAQTGLTVSEVYTIATINPTVGGLLAIALR